MAKYLICGQAYFDDEYYELTSAKDPEIVIPLGAAASRCLLVLLEAKGQVVTKRDLLQEGWGQYGSVVSGNNVNQAIANIRKCFQELGISADSIVTIPRIGYKTSDAFISEVSRVAQSAATSPSDMTPAADTMISAATVPAPSLTSEFAASLQARRHHRKIYVAFGVLALTSGVAAFVVVPQFQDSPMQAAAHVTYAPISTKGDTRYYVEKGFINKADFISSSIGMLAQYPPRSVSTAVNRRVYINGAIFNGVYSYFLCRNEIEQSDASCVSYVIHIEDAR